MNKVLSVLAVVAILGVSFYAGQKSFGSSLEYEHADVIDLVGKCEGRQFIGGCTKCDDCGKVLAPNGAKRKYKAGGCSYFKDTFCTLCNSIRHCQQENTFCTNKDDQYCDKCDPGFFGPQCQPCKECSDKEYVFKKCVTQKATDGPDSDTVCNLCTQCTIEAQKGKRSFLSKTCRVGGNGVTKVPGEGVGNDSKCTPCRVCLSGFEYTTRTCQSPFTLGFFQDPENKDEKRKLPPALKLQEIENDKKKAIQENGVPATAAARDTRCTSCTGCMAEEHPSFMANKKKNDAQNQKFKMNENLQLYATSVCNNGWNKDTKLYEPKGAQTCKACKTCKAGQYISRPCDPGHPHKEWRCKTFKVTAKGKVEISGQTKQCDIEFDPVTRQPKVAAGEERVQTIAAEVGKNTMCTRCTVRPANHWTVFPCNPKHTSDAVHQKCSKCLPGEYQYQGCKDYSDTICPSCPSAREKLYKNSKEFKSGLKNCKDDPETGLPKTQCSTTVTTTIGGKSVVIPKSTRCGHWLGKANGAKPFKWAHNDKTMHKLPRNPDRCLPWTRGDVRKFNECGEWQSECKDDFFGPSCCYHKHPYSCGVITTRERSAKRMKYPTDEAKLKPATASRPIGYPKEGYFAQFCMSLCSEFPDCLAVEVQDDGTIENPAGTPDEMNKYKKCFFKSAFTQDQKYRWKGAFTEEVNGKEVKREGDPKFDCYSNTCRQNIYTMTGDKPVKIINYRVPKKSKTQDQLNVEVANAKCAKKCPAGSAVDCVTKCVKAELKLLRKTSMTKNRMTAVANNVKAGK